MKLDRAEIALIKWALVAAIDQHEKFLMHDDWCEGIDNESVVNTTIIHSDLERALSIFNNLCQEDDAKHERV